MDKLKKILMFPWNIILVIVRGFYYLCSLASLGFYFYFVKFFELIKKITHSSKLDKIINHFKKRENQPEFLLLLILYVTTFWAIYNIFYVKPTKVVDNEEYIASDSISGSGEDSTTTSGANSSNGKPDYKETNLFRRYGATSLNNVNFDELTSINSDTVAWLSVDGTNVNYPITQTTDNDYYLNHSFDKSKKKSGWTFMDYRNTTDELDRNTIIYGHNMLNKTAFGSLSNLFTDKWKKNSNKTIILLTKNKKYIFKVFSIYITTPEVSYLQTEFLNDKEYQLFVDKLNAKTTVDLGEIVNANEKILTLSTCTDDNTGRKVIHAKMISESDR